MDDGQSTEQRWSRICREWGIGIEDAQAVRAQAALEKLRTILVNEPVEMVLRSCQVLLADPENPNLRNRECFDALCRVFGDDEWSHAGVAARSPWVLQALLISAWPDDKEAADIAALFEHSLKARLHDNRQKDSLGTWHRRLATIVVENQHEQEAESEPELAVLRSDTQSALRALTSKSAQAIGFDVFGPHIQLLLHAIRQDLLILTEGSSTKERIKGTDSHIAHFQGEEGSESWAFNHYAAQLNTALKIFAHTCLQWGYPMPWDDIAFLQGQQSKGHAFQAVGKKIADVLSAILHSVRDRGQFIFVRKATESDPSLREELDLLWWGQAGYSHILRRPYRKIANPAQLLLLAAAEAAQRSASLPPEPSAAFLVRTLSSLGISVDESRPLSTWLAELYETLKDPEVHSHLEMNSTFADVVSKDPLGLPVSFARHLARENNPLHLDDARTRIALDLDLQLDRGDWASWIFREFRLELLFPEEP